MGNLESLPNVGKVLANKLKVAGIETPDRLEELGSKIAFCLIREYADKSICLNSLYALEGAVQQKRWHSLTEDEKEALKIFYKNI